MKVSVLGTEYTVYKKKYCDEPYFEKESVNGYCDPCLKTIVICDMSTYPGFENEEKMCLAVSERETLRHEIVHAFLDESGLRSCSLEINCPWVKNEEMIDWFALIGPKIYKAWCEVGAIEEGK